MLGNFEFCENFAAAFHGSGPAGQAAPGEEVAFGLALDGPALYVAFVGTQDTSTIRRVDLRTNATTVVYQLSLIHI